MCLLLKTYVKSYMESLTTPLDLTLLDPDRSKSRLPRYQSLKISQRSLVRPYVAIKH